LWGRPATGVESKYLLPGIALCSACGGGMIVRSRSHGRQRGYFYGCSSYHQRGKSVCTNLLEDSMAAVDRAVLGAFEKQLLGPGMVDEILDAAVARMPGASADTQQDKRR
jgi:hypothetical protein